MSRTGFALVMGGAAIAILALMWLGWRSRAKRDAGIRLAVGEIAGALVAEFTGLQYVSTTPLGAPLERVSIPGLRYKGLAALVVREGGVTVTVTGEPDVSIPGSDVLGASRASGRVGKAVETGGLSVLEWRAANGRELESGFRFTEPAQQREFEAAIGRITGAHTQTTAQASSASADSSPTFTDTTQEDA